MCELYAMQITLRGSVYMHSANQNDGDGTHNKWVQTKSTIN